MLSFLLLFLFMHAFNHAGSLSTTLREWARSYCSIRTCSFTVCGLVFNRCWTLLRRARLSCSVGKRPVRLTLTYNGEGRPTPPWLTGYAL